MSLAFNALSENPAKNGSVGLGISSKAGGVMPKSLRIWRIQLTSSLLETERPTHQITQLLIAWSKGDKTALDNS